MLTRPARELLHLLLGGAVGTLVAWLGYATVLTLERIAGAQRVAAAAIVAMGVVLAVALLVSAPVRQAEAAVARALLDDGLPDVVESTSWSGRLRGLAWAVTVVALGSIALLTLLVSLPLGAGLVVWPLGDATTLEVAGSTWRVGTGWQAVWTVPLGAVVMGLGVALQPLLGSLLRRSAGRVIGPTLGDRREADRLRLLGLARANEVARDLHDGVGHALTGISVTAEAARVLREQQPERVWTALDDVQRTAGTALAQLDALVGRLRGAPDVEAAPGLDALDDVVAHCGLPVRLHRSGRLDDVPASLGQVAYRVVQEGLTNAVRYGGEPVEVEVRADAIAVDVGVTSRLLDGVPAARRGGRGLDGVRERVLLLDGACGAGPDTGPDGSARWRLWARLPIR